jgi:Predicted integral membrane protein (DUF2269)
MTLYLVIRMLHIFGAVTMFALMGVDLANVSALSRARTADQARAALDGYRVMSILGPIALLLILVPGIYMAIQWGWPWWIRLSMLTFLVAAILGPVLNRRPIGAITAALTRGPAQITADLERRLRHPMLRTSFILRACLILGIVVLMTTKPSAVNALLIVGGVLVLAGALIAPLWTRPRTT